MGAPITGDWFPIDSPVLLPEVHAGAHEAWQRRSGGLLLLLWYGDADANTAEWVWRLELEHTVKHLSSRNQQPAPLRWAERMIEIERQRQKRQA